MVVHRILATAFDIGAYKYKENILMIKKHTYYTLLFTICSLLLTTTTIAQNKAAVKVLARPQKDKILLRWATTTPISWRLSNEYGFIVERYTVTRDKKILAEPEKKIISTIPFKPQPLDNWKTLAEKDNYAAVIAQAIYGKDFELSGGDNTGLTKIINQANELEQRFSLSLYAADNSFEAAKLAGWAYEDKDVKQNEKYLYRIISAIPTNKLKIDSASAYIGIMDYQQLPIPSDIAIVFGDKTAMLSWDYSILKNYYNNYFIEKSTDGKTYNRLSDLPVTNLNNKEDKPSNRMYFIDSLKDNEANYYYQIRGVSPFGEVGPASKPIKGKGKQLLAQVPNINHINVNAKGQIEIEWFFDGRGNDLIKSFTLNQANKEQGPYKAVIENINSNSRTITFDKPYATNYFTITAIAKEGQNRTSFPVLVQPVDSFPPQIPTGLNATIDSNGIVTIKWNQNSEADLLGYKIFRANNKQEELATLTPSVHKKCIYRDTVNIKTLNNKVYYAVASVDQRYNQSQHSTIIEIKKPDIIPPSAPLFTDYQIKNDSVILNWVNSPDEDVTSHQLYRRALNSPPLRELEGVELLQTFTDTTSEYIDLNAEPGKQYEYNLIAIDASGLKTNAPNRLQIKIPDNNNRYKIKALNTYINTTNHAIEIFWKDDLKEVQAYNIYKTIKGKPITLWKVITTAQAKQVADTNITIGETYQYAVMPVMKSGIKGKIVMAEVKY